MEDGQNTGNSQVQAPPQETLSPNVSFPTVGQPQKGGGAKTLLVVGILVLVAILGFVIYKSATSKGEALAEPTPIENQIVGNQDVNTDTPTPVATAKPIDKTQVSIQIQNGTGITGEAAYLQTALKDLGYTDVKVGNAGDQTASVTVVTFSSSLDSAAVSELTLKLNSIYQNVTVKTSSTQTFDVVVVTGLRKGTTAKPSASPSPKPSTSPSVSPSTSPTGTQ
ncbi:MAG: LytR C-terminal domain-containing protein [Candidatus Woesebacteria bacterium]|nr:MAG: LytR C-terminal domain-containing protein [Candidatus Woesebacteria bacterium]